MPTFAKFKTSAVIFDAIPSASAPADSLFKSSDSSTIVAKSDSGESNVSASQSSKLMQSGYVGVILVNTPLSKRADGKVVPADSDGSGTQQPIGFAAEQFAALNDIKSVKLIGTNIVSVLTGLGFAPGDEVYLGETPGTLINDAGSYTGNNDSIVRLGIADCASGAASATSVDLIACPQVIARPIA